ncbi:PRC-barrel domain-containing protein [Variovorax paradoxus]|jgi:sporulation protein YlmC with PRC-barrel domain|uniref:PRC-barrel domain-containing protein n=1 Tax=Variovorax TaxID=34072 RepID=UPI001ABCAE42
MKKSNLSAAVLSAMLMTLPVASQAQTAGATVFGVSESVLADVAKGWSVKKTILNAEVRNDAARPESLGKVEDLIVAPDGTVSYLIVNASKFLGIDDHRISIPVSQFRHVGNILVLPGATKEELRKVPVFIYSKN